MMYEEHLCVNGLGYVSTVSLMCQIMAEGTYVCSGRLMYLTVDKRSERVVLQDIILNIWSRGSPRSIMMMAWRLFIDHALYGAHDS